MATGDWRAALRSGLITFGVIFYLNVLGLPQTLGRVSIGIFTFVVGLMSFAYLRARRGEPARRLPALVLLGLAIGLIAGGGLALVTAGFASLQANGVEVQKVFATVLPTHTAALTGLTREDIRAGANVAPGLVRLALLLTGGGLAGALLTLGFTESRRERQRAAWQGAAWRRWLVLVLPFVFYGLFFLLRVEGVAVGGSNETIVGLVLIFLFVGAALFGLRTARPGREQLILGLIWLAMLLILPRYTDLFQRTVVGKVFIFATIGLGLNIVIGYAGMLHLGFAAFFAVGAYVYGFFTSPSSYLLKTTAMEGLSFWSSLPIAIVLSLAVGILLGIPILRTRGDYLAIVTLGFAEIIRLLLLNLRTYTNGPGGLLNLDPPVLFGRSLGNPSGIFYMSIALVAIVVFVSLRLRDSRLGRAWVAMREDEDVAQVMGINPVTMKLLAFAIGAAFAGAAGVLYGARQVNIFPDNFTLLVSIDILSLVIIGGLGSIEGILLGAFALEGLPEILRGVDEYRIVAFGALLVVMMITRPQGLLPSARRELELKAEERSQDAWLKLAQPPEDEESA